MVTLGSDSVKVSVLSKTYKGPFNNMVELTSRQAGATLPIVGCGGGGGGGYNYSCVPCLQRYFHATEGRTWMSNYIALLHVDVIT